MRGVGERVEQAHRDRLYALLQEDIDLALGLLRIERPLHMAASIDPLVHHPAQIAIDQWWWLLPGDVVEARHAERADLQDVAEAFGRDEADLGALHLQDGVGGNRRAVADLLDVATGEAALGEHLGETLDDGRA